METGTIPHVAKERRLCMWERKAIKYLPKNEITEKQEKCMKKVNDDKRDLKSLSIFGKMINLSHSKRNPNFKHFILFFNLPNC